MVLRDPPRSIMVGLERSGWTQHIQEIKLVVSDGQWVVTKERKAARVTPKVPPCWNNRGRVY